MHRDQAKRLILRVQAVAGVIGLGAVAAAVVPVAPPAFERVTVPAPKAKPANERPASVEIDVTRFDSVLSSIAPPVAVVVKPKDETKPDLPPAPPPPPVWKYLGGLFMPDRALAIVVVSDKQRMLKVGDKVNDAELLAIADKSITIRQEGVEKRIDLAPRQSGALRVVSAGANPQMQADMAAQMAAQAQAQAQAMMNANGNRSRGGLTPEQMAARAKHFNRSADEAGKFDDKMARMERVDMMLKTGRVNEEQATKLRDMVESGASSQDIEGVIGPDSMKEMNREGSPK